MHPCWYRTDSDCLQPGVRPKMLPVDSLLHWHWCLYSPRLQAWSIWIFCCHGLTCYRNETWFEWLPRPFASHYVCWLVWAWFQSWSEIFALTGRVLSPEAHQAARYDWRASCCCCCCLQPPPRRHEIQVMNCNWLHETGASSYDYYS